MSPLEQLFLVSMLAWTTAAQAVLLRLEKPSPWPVDRRAGDHRTRALSRGRRAGRK